MPPLGRRHEAVIEPSNISVAMPIVSASVGREWMEADVGAARAHLNRERGLRDLIRSLVS